MPDLTLPGRPDGAPPDQGKRLPYDLISAGRPLGQPLDALNKFYLRLIQKRIYTISIPFQTQAAPVLIRPAEGRYYFLIQNIDAANSLFIGIGAQPVANRVGFILAPNGSFEPSWVPQEDIWVLGSAAPTSGYMIVGNRLADL